MGKFVSVQILRSMQIGSQTHREPCGWFRFGEGGEFHRVTEIFIRYLQIHLRNRSCCCKNSNSQIDIIFRDERTETLRNCCVSCGQSGRNLNCVKCVTHRIQMEEVFHIDDVWTNTGRENIYSTAQSLCNRDEDLLYSIGIITTPIHIGCVVSCERGVVGRFLGCRSRESKKIATLSKLCINTIIANSNNRGIEKLPLPNALKKGINNNLHSNERNIGNRVLKAVHGENYPETKKNSVRATSYRGPGCFFFTTFPEEKIKEYGEIC